MRIRFGCGLDSRIYGSCFSQVYENSLKGCCFVIKDCIPPNTAQSFVSRELSFVHRFVLIVSIAFSEAIVCVDN